MKFTLLALLLCTSPAFAALDLLPLDQSYVNDLSDDPSFRNYQQSQLTSICQGDITDAIPAANAGEYSDTAGHRLMVAPHSVAMDDFGVNMAPRAAGAKGYCLYSGWNENEIKFTMLSGDAAGLGPIMIGGRTSKSYIFRFVDTNTIELEERSSSVYMALLPIPTGASSKTTVFFRLPAKAPHHRPLISCAVVDNSVNAGNLDKCRFSLVHPMGSFEDDQFYYGATIKVPADTTKTASELFVDACKAAPADEATRTAAYAKAMAAAQKMVAAGDCDSVVYVPMVK